MTISQATVCARLNTLGLPHGTTVLLIREIEKWNKCCGPEWTVSRLKGLKTDLIRGWSGLEPSMTWVARHKDGRPKGPFGILFKPGSFRQRVKCLNAMMVYTSSYSDKVTMSQWKKFQSSVEHPTMSVSPCAAYDPIISQMPKPRGVGRGIVVHLDDVPNSDSKRVPLRTGKTVPEAQLEEWFVDNASNSFVRAVVSRYGDKLPLDDEFRTALHRVQAAMPSWSLPPSVGKISFIQEAGFKLRAVANPNRLVQLFLKPLQVELFNYLREIEEDCTYDQDKGVQTVFGWLKENLNSEKVGNFSTEISSIDLSDATNNFPLDLQLHVLRAIFPHLQNQIDLFEEASRGPWLVNDPTKGERTLRWTKGQPLGLGPSFASFALAHHVVVREAIRFVRGADPRYVILGDDIVIRDHRVAERYMYLLSLLGVPVSPSKTIASCDVAEFAGKVVTKDGVISPIRFNEISDRSFVDIAKQLGPRSLGLFRPRQRAILSKIASIPQEFGGLGWNPNGLTYEQRVRDGLDVIRLLESEGLRSLQRGGNSQILRLLLGLNIRLSGIPGSKVEAHQQRPVPRTYSSILERLADLFNYRETKVPEGIDLPGFKAGMVSSDPRGITALEILEMKLRQINKML